MTRLVKASMIAFGIVITLVLATAVTFTLTFDINDTTVRIKEAVRTATGRTLTIRGDVQLSYFPSIGISIEGVSLSNADGFGDAPMVEAGATHVAVRLLPLLVGDVRFHDLSVTDLVVRLSRREDGSTNWAGMGAAPESADDADAAASADSVLPDIDGVKLKNARLVWQDYSLNSRFEVDAVSLETGRIRQDASISVTADLRYSCDRPQLRGIVSLAGKASFDSTLRHFGVSAMRVSIEAEGADVPGKRQSGEFSVQSATLDTGAESIQVSGLTGTALDATMHLDGTLSGLTDGLKSVDATVAVEPFNGREMLSALGLDLYYMAGDSAMTSLAGQGKVEYAPGRVHLSQWTADVDGARLTGDVELKTGEASRLVARLAADRLDIDPYLPSVQSGQSDGKGAEAGIWPTCRILHGDLLRLFDLDVTADVGELVVQRVRLQSVRAEIKGENGRVHVSPFKADLYSGSLSGEAVVNAQSKDTLTKLALSLEDVNAGALINDAADKPEYEGRLTFEGSASCRGERVTAMLASMDGQVAFSFRDGVFPGVNLIGMAKRTHEKQGANQGKVTAREGEVTRYGTISGTGHIKKGVVYTKDLEIKAPGLWANGVGSTELVSGKLDYLLKVKLVPLKHEKVKSSDELFGVTVPIRVAGSVGDPYYWVSISEYAKSLGGAVIGVGSSIIGGVFDAIKGVGDALTPSGKE